MTLLNGFSCSIVSITVSAVAFGTLLKTSKNVLTKENQDNAVKIANVVVLTSGLLGFYHGYYNNFLPKRLTF